MLFIENALDSSATGDLAAHKSIMEIKTTDAIRKALDWVLREFTESDLYLEYQEAERFSDDEYQEMLDELESAIRPLRSKIFEQRELMQDDIRCIMDGVDDRLTTHLCQVVVDRMGPLLLEVCE